MDDEVTVVVRVRPATPERPWRASVQHEETGERLEFVSPEALGRYLGQIEPTRPQKLR